MSAVPGLVRQSARFSVNRHNQCAGLSQNRRTVAPILTAAPYRNTILKTYKIYTGAHRCAPCRSPAYSPLPLPLLYHPITLTPDTGAAPDAAISLRFCGQTHGLAHIMGIDDTGTMGGISASADAPAGRNGMGRTANQGIKRGPRIAPGP